MIVLVFLLGVAVGLLIGATLFLVHMWRAGWLYRAVTYLTQMKEMQHLEARLRKEFNHHLSTRRN